MAAPAGFEPAYSGETVRSLSHSAKGSSEVYLYDTGYAGSCGRFQGDVLQSSAPLHRHCITVSFVNRGKKLANSAQALFLPIMIWCQNAKRDSTIFCFLIFKKCCVRKFFSTIRRKTGGMIRPQRENAATKQMVTKTKPEPFQFESCYPFQSNCVFPQIRHLGPTVKILGCLPGIRGFDSRRCRQIKWIWCFRLVG